MHDLECFNHISATSSIIQRRQVQELETLGVRFISQLGDESRSSTLYAFNCLLIGSVEWAPDGTSILKVGSNQRLIKQGKSFTVDGLE